MYLFKTPKLLKWAYSGLTWSKNSPGVYLTFDDGPVPEATLDVLDILESFQIKASFFCVGDNVVKHKAVFEKIVAAGHSVGNHTQHHLLGWKTDNKEYIENVAMGFESMRQAGYKGPLYFRPPYGKAKKSQIRAIKKRFQCEFIMWDVLSYDFVSTLPQEVSLQKSLQHTKDGSIVLFHDSIKTIDKLKQILPLYIEGVLQKGLEFKPI